jgi:hypothetical protein
VLLWLVQVAWKVVATSAVGFDTAPVTWPCMAVMQVLQTWQAVGSHLPRVSHDTTPVLGKHEQTRVVLAMLQKVPVLLQSAVTLQLPAGALPEMSATAFPPYTPSTVQMSKACTVAAGVAATWQGVSCTWHSARDTQRAATLRPRFPATLLVMAAAVASHACGLRPVPVQKVLKRSAITAARVVSLTMSGKTCKACTHTSHALQGCITQLPSARHVSDPVAGSQLQMVLSSVILQSKPVVQSLLLKQVPRGLNPAGRTPGGRSPSLTPSREHLSCA